MVAEDDGPYYRVIKNPGFDTGHTIPWTEAFHLVRKVHGYPLNQGFSIVCKCCRRIADDDTYRCDDLWFSPSDLERVW